MSQPGSPTAVLRNVSSLESNVGVEPLQNAAGSCSAADKFVITSGCHESVSLRNQKKKIMVRSSCEIAAPADSKLKAN